jgi:hypothetical protein
MQSTQETVLEEFMQRSFGAQFLYIPKKYRKGSAHREPADLAWVDSELVALFYLTSSNEELDQQIEHNLRQANGYRRLWATKKPAYALRGSNRFGDNCFVPYDTIKNQLIILVVSCECGVKALSPLASEINNAVLVIPEALLHWISSFGGTFVDLLHIISTFIQLIKHTPDVPVGTDSKKVDFQILGALVQKYVKESILKADPEGIFLRGTPSEDFVFMNEHISRMRMPANMGLALSSSDERKVVARFFGDLMLVEFASIAAAAERAIQFSEPPRFRKWVVMKIRGLYYSFVIATVNFGTSKNVTESTVAALEACKNDEGIRDAIMIQYGYIDDGLEFRTPIMITIPTPDLPRLHALVLAEQLISLSIANPEVK